jgi:hypothetical protein
MNTKIKIAAGSISLIAAGIAAGVLYLGTLTSRTCRDVRYPEAEVRDGRASEQFSSSYQQARDRFLEAAVAAGASIEGFQNPNSGPQGESLVTDVALFGPEDANTVLVVSSGTHGVEGFAGSGIQTGLLREGIAQRLPPGASLLMIHSINPFGMAHLRRVNEDNVDLNRNFRDHSKAPPGRSEYEQLADVIAPGSLSFWAEVASWSRLYWFDRTAGRAAMQRAVSQGQYSYPDGLFFGGTFETWSNRTLTAITDRYLSQAGRVVVVDVHTGLGEYGNAEIILNVPGDSPAYRRAVAIWGQEHVRSTVIGGSVSGHLDASVKLAFAEMLPQAEVTAISLEFGTLPTMDIFKALRAENWLHHHGGGNHPKAENIKNCLLRAFHPDSDEWEASVWVQGREVVEQALAWSRQVSAVRRDG